MYGGIDPQWWIDEFSQYGLLKHLRINRFDTSIDGEKLTDHNLSEIDLDHSDFFTFKIAAPATANAGGLTILAIVGAITRRICFSIFIFRNKRHRQTITCIT